MLLKGNEVIGLKVVTINEGKEVGKIKDIVYDAEDNKVKAFILSEGGLLGNTRIILYSSIKSIGKDAVMIVSPDSIFRAEKAKDNKTTEIAKGDQYLVNTKLISESGDDLGKISDILFNPIDGKVEELEVSTGMMDEMIAGKKKVKVSDILTVGKDATIVKDAVEESIEHQSEYKGLKDKVNEIKQTVNEKTPEITGNLKASMEETKDNLHRETAKLSEKTDYIEDNLKRKSKKITREIKQRSQDFQPMIGSVGGQGKAKQQGEIDLPRGTNIEEPDGTKFSTIINSKLKKEE
jgi:uncharacterized protein YrrD